jgi:hypothetical protein
MMTNLSPAAKAILEATDEMSEVIQWILKYGIEAEALDD